MTDERTRTLLFTIMALAAATLALVVAGLTLPDETRKQIFSEAGPFEMASEGLWVLLGIACLVQSTQPWQRRLLFATAAVFLAMREADWHKAFTADSIFNSNYYLESSAPLWEKAAGGAVALSALACLLALLVLGWRSIWKARRYTEPWGKLIVLGAALLPTVKLLDRAYNVLKDDFAVTLPDQLNAVVDVLEEGVETLLPVIFLVAVRLYRLQERPIPQPGP